jgi:hypothetical protein
MVSKGISTCSSWLYAGLRVRSARLPALCRGTVTRAVRASALASELIPYLHKMPAPRDSCDSHDNRGRSSCGCRIATGSFELVYPHGSTRVMPNELHESRGAGILNTLNATTFLKRYNTKCLETSIDADLASQTRSPDGRSVKFLKVFPEGFAALHHLATALVTCVPYICMPYMYSPYSVVYPMLSKNEMIHDKAFLYSFLFLFFVVLLNELCAMCITLL